MSNTSDGDNKWIFHAKCHVSKFTYAEALRKKAASEVKCAIRKMFHLYGEPQFLQHDCGMEFRASEVQDMLQNEFPNVTTIKSRPRNPQQNGLIEREHSVLEERIMAWKAETGRNDWSSVLSEIIYRRNQEFTRTLGTVTVILCFR